MNKLAGIILLILLSGCTNTMNDDLWLENIDSDKSLDWVRQQNKGSIDALKKSPLYQSTYDTILDLLQDKNRIPYGSIHNGWFSNFWTDEHNPRGLWRRCSAKSYLQGSPKWEVLLDIDKLNKLENKSWVFKGGDRLSQESPLYMLSLSPGGSDASVTREYDINTKSFVENGFEIPLSKTQSCWLDRDTLLIGTTLKKDEVNESGYPRLLKIWKRGTKIEDAPIVFESSKTDTFVFCSKIGPESDGHVIVSKGKTFYDFERYIYENGQCNKLSLPLKHSLKGYYQGQLIILLKEEWHGFPSGSLVAVDLEQLKKNKFNIQSVITPTESLCISGAKVGKTGLFVTTLNQVKSQILHFTFNASKWQSKKLDLSEKNNNTLLSVSYYSDTVLLSSTGMLTPSTVSAYHNGKIEKIDQLPERFKSEQLHVERLFSTSKDGTKVPYLLVGPKNMKKDGSTPTILWGYGGFEISILPSYNSVLGKAWLEKGGAYVIANIRGGGEFGPKWHQAALKTNRQKAYDDFISVAEDLINTKVTSPPKLAIKGGSNGGLLMGVMLTQRPGLFKAILCQVPLLDMLRYHKLLAGASWVGEYGSPEDKDMANFLKTYSPYHNVLKEENYPEIFFMTSTRDDRVHPGHARRMAHKMISQGHRIFYYENIEGGHGGAADHHQRALWSTLEYIYLYNQLGM